MERFTYKHDGQWCINGARNGEHRGALTSDVRANYWGEAVDQLAAYEDSKLTPDQVDQIRRAAEYMMFPSVGDFVRYAISNFEELQKLKRDIPYGQPLTLDELKHMEGHPVWVKVIDHSVFADKTDDFDGWGMVRKSWVRIWDEKRADLIHIDYDFESYGKEWVAYAMPVKYGRWEWNEYGQMFCSECQAYPELAIEKPFCPNCGTPMTQDDEGDVYTKSTMVFVCCKECVSSGRNKDGVLICQNQLCPCYNREVFPKFSCICGESRTNYVSEGGNTDD